MDSKHFSKPLLSMGRASLLCFLLLSLCSQALMSPGSSNFTDELALLSFRSTLSSGSSSLLASWNTSIHFCGWPGVVCGRRHPERVIALLLDSFNLSGGISPFLGNLSFLKVLDLHDNQLVGQLPMELGHLRRLQVLIVGKNHLQGSIPVTLGGCINLKKLVGKNHLQGSIPVTLGGCINLKKLDLRNNQLQGEIPNEIGTLSKLVYLNLRENHLSGEIPRSLADLGSITLLSLYNNRLYGDIPAFWGNLTDLQSLELGDNMLSGAIPSSLGMLPSLSLLNLAINNLSGLVPSSFWNSSSLTKVSLRQNFLSGTIPPNAFDNVPHLQLLYMDDNHFHGPIPASISNASAMMRLQLSWNFFSAIVPPEVGNLRALEFLQISGNLLQVREPKDWEFLNALRNCSQLYALGLAVNKFGGVLPDSISNLSALAYLLLNDNRISGGIPKGISSLNRLQVLLFNNNTMSGSIPDDIGNLINLQDFDLSTNFFSGSLPSSLCRLVDMVVFYAYNNNISGSIPLASGNLTGLTYLRLDANAFSGTIPSTLGNLTQLTELGLSNNYLVGTIPTTIFNLPALSNTVDLSYNSLEGVLPQEIGNLKNIIEFYAQSNKLSGEIPTTIGECLLLQRLFLQNNTLNGSLPLILGQLRGLDSLDLSSNNFSGQIPKSLGDLRMMHYLNLSFNNFSGEVPNFGVFANITAISIQGNGKLCGGIPDLHLPTCSLLPKRNRKFPVTPIVISLVTVLVMLPFLWKFLTWHKKRKTKFQLTTPIEGHPMISYAQLVRATDGFSASNLLGSGSFGSVYKGELNGQEYLSTNLVAVKVLKLLTPNALKSFAAECEALRNMRHRNLVKIITICSSIDARGADFKAIVYAFMHNGSLEGWLHPDINDQTEQRYLNLLERVTTLVDVAYALDYLHCHGPEPVVHCDIKSSNVLLDADMVAHVGDFGLAKILVKGNFLLQQSTSSMGFRGTIGYAAPEYGAGNMVSTHGDIYSYGILVLETIIGKRPTDRTFRQGLSLREYVDLTLQNRIIDAVDPRLSLDLENERHTMGDSSYKIKMDCVFSLLSLGMSCTQESPSSRMPTDGIIKELLAIKDSLLREHRT